MNLFFVFSLLNCLPSGQGAPASLRENISRIAVAGGSVETRNAAISALELDCQKIPVSEYHSPRVQEFSLDVEPTRTLLINLVTNKDVEDRVAVLALEVLSRTHKASDFEIASLISVIQDKRFSIDRRLQTIDTLYFVGSQTIAVTPRIAPEIEQILSGLISELEILDSADEDGEADFTNVPLISVSIGLVLQDSNRAEIEILSMLGQDFGKLGRHTQAMAIHLCALLGPEADFAVPLLLKIISDRGTDRNSRLSAGVAVFHILQEQELCERVVSMGEYSTEDVRLLRETLVTISRECKEEENGIASLGPPTSDEMEYHRHLFRHGSELHRRRAIRVLRLRGIPLRSLEPDFSAMMLSASPLTLVRIQQYDSVLQE
ncbi:MAG: hypothetical protein JNL58_29070 [Planctomyces sp.]|nr:hypothetical protein [Planctomyces sp.]